jgi:hypothetical protein
MLGESTFLMSLGVKVLNSFEIEKGISSHLIIPHVSFALGLKELGSVFCEAHSG